MLTLGIIYAVLQTPPGRTLEYTNEKSQELERIAKKIEEVTSVTSLAGYEVLTEGRGSMTMEFNHYDEVPGHLADKVIANAKAGGAGTDEEEEG